MLHLDRDLASEVAPIIKDAGSVVLSFFHKKVTRTEKYEDGADHGFVTEADLASESYLTQQLGNLIPGAGFIAEESGKTTGEKSDYCWVIDPLDGTTNFAYGIPYFCISIGLTYQGKPVFGMIYQPVTDELFYATEGKGAFLNGKPIRVSQAPLEKSMITFCLPYEKDTVFENLLTTTLVVAKNVYAIRKFGAAALDIANVAAGRVQGAIFAELGWWDIAAGIVLVQEAGGQTSDFQGNHVGPDYKSFIATGNSEVHQKLLKLLNKQN